MTKPANGGTTFRRANRLRAEADAAHEEVSQERWLLTYSDMITLLLVLFIVLFALSKVDQAKFREFQQSASRAFLTRIPQGTTDAQTKKQSKPSQKTAPVAPNHLEQIKQALSAALESHGLLKDVTLTIDSAGLVEGLVSDTTFFATNSAQLSPVGEQIVDTSASVLRNYPNAIEVAGYTDNEPITGGPFANNWQLSAARATTVVLEMTVKDAVNPGQVVILGYGQFHPLASNSTPAGKAQNRRVDIVISPTDQFKE
jgi:chemotaxis protein MotB